MGAGVCSVAVAVSAARSDPGTAADDYIPGQHCSTQHRSSRVISYAAEHAAVAAVSPAEHLVTSAVALPLHRDQNIVSAHQLVEYSD